MSEFKELIDKISRKDSSPKQMEELTEIMDELFVELDDAHSALYNKYILKFEDIACRISEDKAREIVKAMKPYGEKWSYTTVKDVALFNKVEDDFVKYYLAMNMAYNDFYDTAKYVNKENDESFFFHLAKNFINDVDAKPHKVEKYFM